MAGQLGPLLRSSNSPCVTEIKLWAECPLRSQWRWKNLKMKRRCLSLMENGMSLRVALHLGESASMSSSLMVNIEQMSVYPSASKTLTNKLSKGFWNTTVTIWQKASSAHLQVSEMLGYQTFAGINPNCSNARVMVEGRYPVFQKNSLGLYHCNLPKP